MNYLRRVKRALEKEGRADELKYIAINPTWTATQSETVRVHHHLIVPASCEHIIRMKWGHGGTYCKPLSKQEDYLPIAEYLIAQVRGTPQRKEVRIVPQSHPPTAERPHSRERRRDQSAPQL